ncbi:MAG: hypothetical protein NVSMB27_37050 [Ktedonobacteraceae bacterium]
MNRNVVTFHQDIPLDKALEQLTAHQVNWAPVLDIDALQDSEHVIGIISISTIVRAQSTIQVEDERRIRS